MHWMMVVLPATEMEGLYRFYSAILPTRFARQARLDSQCSCVGDGLISPTPPSQVLALTWHYYMWLHVAYDV